MQLNRTPSSLSREDRNKLNENWTALEQENQGIRQRVNEMDETGSIAIHEINGLKIQTAEQKEGLTAVNTRVDNVVIEAGDAAFNQVIDASKLEWQEPVATFADLATTYPDATEAFTSQTTSDGSVYRFNGSEWKKIQQVDAGPINELDTRLTNALAETAAKAIAANTKARYSVFGEQLSRLRNALANPLNQIVGISFLGDSITWGLSLPDNNLSTPRDGTLSDPRDNYNTKSFVNNFKRYIQKNYMYNASPTHQPGVNTTGDAVTSFNRTHTLFPYGGDFVVTQTGNVHSLTTPALAGSPTGRQISFNVNSDAAYDGQLNIEFEFTGEEFTLSYQVVANSMDYELLIDGVSQGVFTTTATAEQTAGTNRQRVHNFAYIRNKKIVIRSIKNTYEGLQTLKIGAIIINKVVRITNQGIIGTTAYLYKQRNMAGNTNGDGESIDYKDNFVFMQYGANDRLIKVDYAKGVNEFKKNLGELTDIVLATSEVILMCSNPASNENPSSYSFNMQDVKNAVYTLAKEKQLDFVDNYTVFDGFTISSVTADGLHPNELGFAIITNNLTNAVEMS